MNSKGVKADVEKETVEVAAKVEAVAKKVVATTWSSRGHHPPATIAADHITSKSA